MKRAIIILIALLLMLLPAFGSVSAEEKTVLTGITYIDLPEDHFGGPTVVAKMVVDRANDNRGNLELSGVVSYNGQSYPVAFSGVLGRSALANMDRVGRLEDKTGNFQVIHVGLRKSIPVGALNVDRTVAGQDVLVLYLMRIDTREFSLFEVPVSGLGIASAINALFNSGNQEASLGDDYWQHRVFKPLNSGFEEEFSLAAVSHENNIYYAETWSANSFGDTLTYYIHLRAYSNGPSALGRGDGQFNHQLTLQNKWTTSTHPWYESDTSPLVAGTFSDPVIFMANAPGRSEREGDAFLSHRWTMNANRRNATSLTISVGIAKSLNLLSLGLDFSSGNWLDRTETSNEWVYNLPAGEYTKRTKVEFTDRNLINSGQWFAVHTQVAWVGGSRTSHALHSNWNIPIYANYDDGSPTLLFRAERTAQTALLYESGQ